MVIGKNYIFAKNICKFDFDLFKSALPNAKFRFVIAKTTFEGGITPSLCGFSSCNHYSDPRHVAIPDNSHTMSLPPRCTLCPLTTSSFAITDTTHTMSSPPQHTRPTNTTEFPAIQIPTLSQHPKVYDQMREFLTQRVQTTTDLDDMLSNRAADRSPLDPNRDYDDEFDRLSQQYATLNIRAV